MSSEPKHIELGMITLNPSTQEAKASRFLWIQGQPDLLGEF